MVALAGEGRRRSGPGKVLVPAGRGAGARGRAVPLRRRALGARLRSRRRVRRVDPARRRAAQAGSGRRGPRAATSGTRRRATAAGRERALRRRSARPDRAARPLRSVGSADRRRAALARSGELDAGRRRLVGPLPGDGCAARRSRAAARLRAGPRGPLHRRRNGARAMSGPTELRIAAPTDGLDALAGAARAAQIAAAATRWLAAASVACACLLALAVALALVDRSGAPERTQPSASAYLDFDLAVLRALPERSLG